MSDDFSKKLEEIKQEAYRLNDQSSYKPRTFKTSKDGKKILLDPRNDFERNWYENDDAFNLL